ncbi:MAG TPA: GIY-YIG nuclease family protein [Burkholderiaceae bacterium]|nr:GIY-YIG nuclease family protein [Burkholderiaceae bacterium]
MTQYSYVYMLASQRNGILYIGVTTDLLKQFILKRFICGFNGLTALGSRLHPRE